MPNIRVMNWNIQDLSWNKIQINGMATAIARTVVAQQVDILVVVEVCKTNVALLMNHLSAALNAAAGGGTAYQSWFLSHETGTEHYGFIVKDLGLVRPLRYQPNVNTPDGTAASPLRNLEQVRWTSWPDNNTWGQVPAPLPNPPRIPLVDIHSRRPRERQASAKQFRGQTLQHGGYSEGLGYRMPCLALFKVRTANGAYILPIVCCHYAAVRSSTQNNFLAQSQVKQLPQLHIARLYSKEQHLYVNPAQNPPPLSGHLDIDGGANPSPGTLVQNILFTGDFNLDFQSNSGAVNAAHIPRANRLAYDAITPTQEAGGSATPAAQPGNAPQGNAPNVPFTAFSDPPVTSDILPQRLRAAVTTEGTIFREYDPANPPANVPVNTQVIRGATYDNFFYGGAQVRNTVGNFGVGNVDTGHVIDLAANIIQPGAVPAAGQIDVSGPAAHFAALGRRNATHAPNLQANVNANQPLNNIDRWIGAGLVSDHVPVVLEFVCP
ncbi:hypothetical protein [Pyxidicoccus sp. MSG2]|uniref:hypothetical protein n=1 Tax=Pyxidicoccus sp. MSG2 TaxID=2996790 RepID=UPI00226D4B33|nr:hypothetical protein [Pyxidicoccus sp. MSG2]MCY1017194.1 hypothetical protein [Pyxidicoccus sp. MSG2]